MAPRVPRPWHWCHGTVRHTDVRVASSLRTSPRAISGPGGEARWAAADLARMRSERPRDLADARALIERDPTPRDTLDDAESALLDKLVPWSRIPDCAREGESGGMVTAR